MLGLDLVPRIECEPVNVNMLSPVDLFLLHHRSSASTRASSVRRLLPYINSTGLSFNYWVVAGMASGTSSPAVAEAT